MKHFLSENNEQLLTLVMNTREVLELSDKLFIILISSAAHYRQCQTSQRIVATIHTTSQSETYILATTDWYVQIHYLCTRSV